MPPTPDDCQWVKLTKRVVDRVDPPRTGQRFVRDAALTGFALRVTAAGVRSFVVETRIAGRTKRVTLGRYGPLTVEQARRRAQEFLGAVAAGKNPIAERRAAEVQATALAQVFADYLQTRKALKPRTVYEYQRLMRLAFGDWQRRPIVQISKDSVLARHAQLGEHHGPAYANAAMRLLRAVLNYARHQYEDGFGRPVLTENPVSRLNHTRAWFRVPPRRTVIRPEALPAWYTAVDALRTHDAPFAATVADYLLVLLFSGLRRQEAAQLTWADVNLPGRFLTIHDPKNRSPHTLPLSSYLHVLLERRRAQATGAYVFAGTGPRGFLIEPRRYVLEVALRSGIPFKLHDLRRTFLTVAESIDTAPYALKRLVNHKVGNDVTAGYIVTDLERLRDPMQRITDFLLRACGIVASAEVVPLEARPPGAQRPLHSG